uniref:Uncharacterized protein n=1 Tax=Arundo donax TaxID=35708 RepID=A0A0A9HL94_ARUDO
MERLTLHSISHYCSHSMLHVTKQIGYAYQYLL